MRDIIQIKKEYFEAIDSQKQIWDEYKQKMKERTEKIESLRNEFFETKSRSENKNIWICDRVMEFKE